MTQKIIAVVNQKGGVGKTTTSINLAAQLASSDNRVLLMDLDPQGNATSGLGIEKYRPITMFEVLCEAAPLSTAITESHVAQLFLAPSNANLAGAEILLVNAPNREFTLRQSITEITGFDYIVIDCPPSLGLLTVNALTAADYVLIPVQAEYYALEGLSQLLNTIQTVKQGLHPQLELMGVLLTMYDKRNSLSEQVKQEVQSYFGERLMQTMIPRNIRLAEAPSFGRTIFEHDKWSKGARAYKSLAKEVAERTKSR